MHRSIMVVIFAIAAGYSPHQTGAQETRSLSPKEILAKTVITYAECTSYQDTGTVTKEKPEPGKPSPIQGGAPSTFSTSYVRPDKFISDYRFGSGRAKQAVVWTTKEGPRKWWDITNRIETPVSLDSTEIHRLLLLDSETPSQGRVAPFSQLKDLALVGSIKIDDSECYLIEGRMVAINFQSGKPFEVVISYAIDKTSFLIRRIQTEMILVEFRSKSTTDYKPQINADISEKTFTFNPPTSATAGPPGTQAGVQSPFMPQPPIAQAPETRPEYLTPERRTKNLLKNGSFESGTEPWLLQSWRQVLDGATVVESPVHDGTHSVRLQGKTDDVTYRQRVNLQPDHRYLGSGWIKTENVMINEANGTHGANLSIVGGNERSGSFTGTGDWKYATFVFDAAGRNQVEVCARLGHHYSTSSGTAWFDDLCLIDLGPSPVPSPLVMQNGLGRFNAPAPEPARSPDRLILPGALHQMMYTPDGKRLLTTSSSGNAGLFSGAALTAWDLATGRPMKTVTASPGGPIKGIGLSFAISPDGKSLATGGVDGYAQVWDLETLTPRGQPMANVRTVSDPRPMSDPQRSRAEFMTKDLPKNSPLVAILAPPNTRLRSTTRFSKIDQVAFSADGKTVATSANFSAAGRLEFELRTWDAETGKPLTEPVKLGHASRLSFAPDQCTLKPGGPIKKPWARPVSFPSLQLATVSPDSSLVAVTSEGSDRTVEVWDDASGTRIGQRLLVEGPEFDTYFGPALTSLADQLRGARLIKPTDMLSLSPQAISPDNTTVMVVVTLVAGTYPSQLWAWDIATGKPKFPPMAFRPIEGEQRRTPFLLSISPDGSKVALAFGKYVGSQGGMAEVRIVETKAN